MGVVGYQFPTVAETAQVVPQGDIVFFGAAVQVEAAGFGFAFGGGGVGVKDQGGKDPGIFRLPVRHSYAEDEAVGAGAVVGQGKAAVGWAAAGGGGDEDLQVKGLAVGEAGEGIGSVVDQRAVQGNAAFQQFAEYIEFRQLLGYRERGRSGQGCHID